jgi:penicillin-binding protein A
LYFTREIQRLLLGLLIAFGMVGVAAAYWVVTGPERILTRDDNPRRVEDQVRLLRGAIVDRDGEVLVESHTAESGNADRTYLYPSIYSAVGYASLRYGESGAEAAFNELLRGETLSWSLDQFVREDLLHQPQQGTDVRLTLDLDIQNRMLQLMAPHWGAAVVVSVPDGEILGMVSLPTYDSDSLDDNWDTLVVAEGQPFFNRVLQGSYQPGGTMHTLLIAAALVHDMPLESSYANNPVDLGDIVLDCIIRPPTTTLTLELAFHYGCPGPFAELVDQIGRDTVQTGVGILYEPLPLTLNGYVPDFEPQPHPESFDLDEALGQGEITFTPLQMALMTAALINDGNAPHPYTLLQTRIPGRDGWTDVVQVQPDYPLMTAQTAAQIADLFRRSAVQGTARQAFRSGLGLGGHAALAYAGEQTHVVFTGFVRGESGEGAAVALVLERTQDVRAASRIGGSILQTTLQEIETDG